MSAKCRINFLMALESKLTACIGKQNDFPLCEFERLLLRGEFSVAGFHPMQLNALILKRANDFVGSVR